MIVKLFSTLLFLVLLGEAQCITVGSPVKAIYLDWEINWNAPQQSVIEAVDAGYNVIIISFFMSTTGAVDMAQAWAELDTATKQSTIATAHSKGAVVTVSLGGSTDTPYSNDAYSLGQKVANWAKAQYLDGVDFDLENFGQGLTTSNMNAGETVDWVANITLGASNVLGKGGVISHAPQAPYFGPVGNSGTWAGTTGGYTAVYKKTADVITFLNVQFYNQGSSCYVDYNGLFVSSAGSCSYFPLTAVAEIASAGIPYSKIVVGKPVTTAEASNGYVSPSSLHSFFDQAKSQYGWNAGVMGWEWDNNTTLTNWIHTIYPSK